MNQRHDISQQTDEELWRRFQQGDQQALEFVHARLGIKLRAFLATHCRPPLDADDALQEVLLKAVRSCQQYDPQKCRLISWLVTIARNVVIDLRRKRRESTNRDDSPWNVPAAQADESRDRQLAAMIECLQTLGGDFVEVLRQNLFDEQSFEDIAREMQIKIKTVYTRASRGKEEVKACVEKKLS